MIQFIVGTFVGAIVGVGVLCFFIALSDERNKHE